MLSSFGWEQTVQVRATIASDAEGDRGQSKANARLARCKRRNHESTRDDNAAISRIGYAITRSPDVYLAAATNHAFLNFAMVNYFRVNRLIRDDGRDIAPSEVVQTVC